MSVQQAESKRTPLNVLHREPGGRMMHIAGDDMPVRYPAGILHAHIHGRETAGLFDDSHMGQGRLQGAAVVTYRNLAPRLGTQG